MNPPQADTSIWIDLLRTGKAGREAAAHISEHVTCGPLVQEVLQGLPDDSASHYFRQAFLALPRLDDPLPVEAFLEAAETFRSGRRRGYTIRSTVDCLIAAIAIRNDVTVWHKDRDYTTIARYTMCFRCKAKLRALLRGKRTSNSPRSNHIFRRRCRILLPKGMAI